MDKLFIGSQWNWKTNDVSKNELGRTCWKETVLTFGPSRIARDHPTIVEVHNFTWSCKDHSVMEAIASSEICVWLIVNSSQHQQLCWQGLIRHNRKHLQRSCDYFEISNWNNLKLGYSKRASFSKKKTTVLLDSASFSPPGVTNWWMCIKEWCNRILCFLYFIFFFLFLLFVFHQQSLTVFSPFFSFFTFIFSFCFCFLSAELDCFLPLFLFYFHFFVFFFIAELDCFLPLSFLFYFRFFAFFVFIAELDCFLPLSFLFYFRFFAFFVLVFHQQSLTVFFVSLSCSTFPQIDSTELWESQSESKTLGYTKSEKSPAFAVELEAHELVFSTTNGAITDLLPHAEESTRTLNIKRGILSTLQAKIIRDNATVDEVRKLGKTVVVPTSLPTPPHPKTLLPSQPAPKTPLPPHPNSQLQ